MHRHSQAAGRVCLPQLHLRTVPRGDFKAEMAVCVFYLGLLFVRDPGRISGECEQGAIPPDPAMVGPQEALCQELLSQVWEPQQEPCQEWDQPLSGQMDLFLLSQTLKLAVWTVQILSVLLFHCDKQAGQGLEQMSQTLLCPRVQTAGQETGWLCAPTGLMRWA